MTPDPQSAFALFVALVVMLTAVWPVSVLLAAKRNEKRAAVLTRQRFEALAREAARRRGEIR